MSRAHKIHINSPYASILNWASVLSNPEVYDRIDNFISNNKDSVFDIIQYSSVLISEIIRNYPKIKYIIKQLLFRLKLFMAKSTGRTNEKNQESIKEESSSEIQQYYAQVFNSIYGYISDIRIAQGIFAIFSYISTFLKDYNSIKKLRNINSKDKLYDFITFALFASYTVFENLGFLLSHGFIHDNFNHLLLPQHKSDKSLSSSDWYYVYSCRFWFLWNAIEVVKDLKSGVPFNLLCDLVLSYHWSTTAGALDKTSFALIGFLNSFTKFKRKLQ